MIDWCKSCKHNGTSDVFPCIVCEVAYDNAPSKYKEVVRCKDCKHKYTNYLGEEAKMIYCIPKGMCKQYDDFCSYGVRKDGE